eukprot:4761290-Pyramimonas_sp.AAC.1
MGEWSAAAVSQFERALPYDIDLAWRIWQDAAGAPQAQIRRQPSNGGWLAGPRAAELDGLWKTFRRQLHDDRREAAECTLGYITSLIDDANTMRLKTWRERISTRSGAARWVKSRVAALQEATLPSIAEVTFTSRELVRRLGESLARRWNASVYQ